MAQQKLADAQVQELLTVGPFLGIDASTSKYYLDQYHANDSIAVVPNREFLGYVTARGRVSAFGGTYLSAFFGLFQFQRTGQTDIYVGAVNSGGVGKLQYAALGGAPTTLVIPAQAPWQNTSFATHQNWMFVADGLSGATPIKVDTSLNVTNWGIVPPASVPTLAQTTGGNLTLLATYNYLVTFSSPNQESSPSAVVSITLTGANNKVTMTAVPVSPDSQVTQRNIYRFGGTMQEILLVGTINDNTTTTFSDSLADIAITGQVLILHRDVPQAFFDFCLFKGRIWGFGYSGTAVGNPATIAGNSDLWYSNYEEPWGFDNVNQVLPVGRNSGGDIAVAVRQLSSILCLLKSESLWSYWGGDNPTTDPAPFMVAPKGCASKNSAFVAYQRLFFVSNELTIEMFDGQNLTNISDNRATGAKSSIKGILDSFSLTDAAASTGFAVDNMACFSFPTQNITFLYDIPTGQWYKLPWATDRPVFNLEEQNLVVASRPSVAGTLDQWFAAETDLGASITSSYISRITDTESPMAVKVFRYAVVLAPVQVGATATVTVAADPLGANVITTNTVNLANTPQSHILSMPPTMMGSEVQVTVSVTSTVKTEIHKVSVYGWVKRQFIVQG